MNCHETVLKLSAYLDAELSAADRVRVEAHVAGCRECAAERDSLAFAWERVRQLPHLVPADDLWPGIEARLGSAAAGVRGSRMRWWSFQAVAAAAAVVGLLAGVRVGRQALSDAEAALPPAVAATEAGADTYFGDLVPGTLAEAAWSGHTDAASFARAHR